MAGFVLTEEQMRKKGRELLLAKNLTRMNTWMWSGTTAGVFPPEVRVEQILREELDGLDPHTREYWLEEPCTCGLTL